MYVASQLTGGSWDLGETCPQQREPSRALRLPSRPSRANPGHSRQIRDVAWRAKPRPERETTGRQAEGTEDSFLSQSHSTKMVQVLWEMVWRYPQNLNRATI